MVLAFANNLYNFTRYTCINRLIYIDCHIIVSLTSFWKSNLSCIIIKQALFWLEERNPLAPDLLECGAHGLPAESGFFCNQFDYNSAV